MTFDAGTNGKFADGASYVFDVREGTPASETVTSSLEPSGYVTTIVPSFSPGVVVSTGVFQSNFVPDEKKKVRSL